MPASVLPTIGDVVEALVTLTGEPHPLLPDTERHPLSPSQRQSLGDPEPLARRAMNPHTWRNRCRMGVLTTGRDR
jgi:hypothetical protein